MPKPIDLTTVSPERAAHLLVCRERKKREYQRRKTELQARNKAWRDANRDKFNEITNAWKKANPERAAKGRSAWYAANRDLQLSRAAKRYVELADSVVKSLYVRDTHLQSKDVPDELVPCIRTTIQLKRAIKEQKRELR